jgi:Zn-dependent M28 family amino/carboxypeptidase
VIGAACAGVAAAGILGISALAVWTGLVRMPGASYAGPFGPLSDRERDVAAALRHDVERLSDTGSAASAVEDELRRAGLAVRRPQLQAVEAEIAGRDPGEIVVVGARLGESSTGADDTSGVAALLALGRAFAGAHPRRTLRFVAFAGAPGSAAYAHRARQQGERIVAVLSLDALGRYSDRPASQRYPFPLGLLYPATGDFVAFVGNTASRGLLRRTVSAFRAAARFPSEGLAAPDAVPGVDASDHGAFWEEGYPEVMVTDTGSFRGPGDAPERLSYGPLARVVGGLARVVEDLAEG